MTIAGYSRKPGAGRPWSFESAWSVLTDYDISEDRFYVRLGRWRAGKFLSVVAQVRPPEDRPALAKAIRRCRAYLREAME